MQDKYAAFNAHAEEVSAKFSGLFVPDGSSVMDLVRKYGMSLLAELVDAAKKAGLIGGDAKQVVLNYVAQFYDTVIAPMDLPGPDAVLDPMLRKLLLAIADNLIDGLMNLTPAQVSALAKGN